MGKNPVKGGLIGREKRATQAKYTTAVSFGWLLLAVISYLTFAQHIRLGQEHNGEHIQITRKHTEDAMNFLAAYILPLINEEIDTPRGFFFEATIIILMIAIIWKSNLYYQNPILTLFGYRVFDFTIKRENEENQETLIGITIGKRIDQRKIVKQDRISDNVFIVFNDEEN